jgi:dTDP-4-dehydrorhamnose 3,5-epimerase
MNILQTEIPGLLIFEPKVFKDQRGQFFESFNQRNFHDELQNKFVQDNESLSYKNVIRGLHYQLNPFAQAKLIRVPFGKIYDIALDLRNGSPGFGKWFGIELSAENKKQLFIPAGFAHGFSVLSDEAVVSYKCSEYYSPDYERGVFCFDPSLKIDWQVDTKKAIISEKDQILPQFVNAEMNFFYQSV